MSRLKDVAAGAIWAYAVWLLLTWTATAEQLVFGAVVAVVVAITLAPLGPVVPPWRLLSPRRLVPTVALLVGSAWRIVIANVALARRIWSPLSKLRTGMLVLPTRATSDGELAAVGLITSLIVDNQLVDLDRSEHELQYHATDVPAVEAGGRYDKVNGPTERQVRKIARGH
jgi:multicomponent Na+:H+ antiporter subunit E